MTGVNHEVPQAQRSAPGLNPFLVWGVGLAVLLVAFFLRFYRLADHPLGLFFDPAINGLDAVRLMQRGGPVIFFPTNGGREALFIYLLIPFIYLFGTTPFSIRFVTAAFGLLNVALLFAFLYDPQIARQALSRQGRRPVSARSRLWLAALGSLVLAASYWPVALSRLGQRPIMVPALSAPIFWFFLKGWAGGRRRWFILSGLLLGLAGHTYSAARLLPLILGLALLPELVRLARDRSRRMWLGRQLTNLSLLILTALIVYLPLAWYLLSHPAQFSARAFSVMVWNFLDTPADIAAEVGRNLLRVLGFFCCAGSPNPIFGLPGYPGLAPFLAPFLLIGLIGALLDGRRLFPRLVALWWLVGLLPSVLAIEAPHPWRMIVALVPTAILVALAPFYLLTISPVGRLSARRPRFAASWPFWLALLLTLAAIPGLFRAYFIDWTGLKVTRSVYDYGAVTIRDAVIANASPDRPVYLPLSRFNDSPLLFYLSGPYPRRAALSAPAAREALAMAPEKNIDDTTWVRLDGRTATILPPLTPTGRQQIQAALRGPNAASLLLADGEVAARLAPLAVDPVRFVQSPDQAVTAGFGPLGLIGATYPAEIDPAAAKLPVTLYWQADQPMRTEYELLLHLVDDQRRAWGSGDARPTDWVYPTSFWRPGRDRVAASHQLSLESDPLPPGRYWLALSLYDPATGRRLPLTKGRSSAPDTFFIGPLKVPLPEPDSLPASWQPQDVTFGRQIRLAGAAVDRLALPAGEPLHLSLLWEALVRPEADYTVFVHLLDAEGLRAAGQDVPPLAGRYPTAIWSPGERVLDRHTLPTVDDRGQPLPPGRYRLALGLYHQPTGARLPVWDEQGREVADSRAVLDWPVEIK